MRAWVWCSFVGTASVVALGCGDDGGVTETDSATGDGSETQGDGSMGDGDAFAAGSPILGCPEGTTCTFVAVSQTLDDRVELFVPDDPDGNLYRGAIDFDFKPNGPTGDNAGEKLDEPFGLSFGGGFVHTLVGHYPTPEAGSLVSIPYEFLGGRDVGSTIAASELLEGSSFAPDIVGEPLGELEPIFALAYDDRLLISVFNNDLFATETSWTNAGKLLVVDAAEPSRRGSADLSGLEGGACAGAADIAVVGPNRVAVACDGNEAVAFLDVSGVGGTTDVSVEAATVVGQLCDLPPMNNRRVRYLAPDGAGGVVVALAPGFNPIDPSELWAVDSACQIRSITRLSEMGEYQLGQVVRRPTEAGDDLWFIASGAGMLANGRRGIFVARDTGSTELEVCEEPMGGFEASWETAADPIDPFALTFADVDHLVVGASPSGPSSADDPGYGKVLWATLSGDAPCELTADVIDLTDGSSGRAPAPDPADPKTWRRAPHVVTAVRIDG